MQSTGEHIRLYEGTMVNNRYRVVCECGSGNFARVYRCVDTNSKASVALKFLKREYARDAPFEVDVLKAVTRLDLAKEQKVLHLIEYFVYNRYPCFVFPLRGNNLKARKYGISAGNLAAKDSFSREEFNLLARDLINALYYLHTKVKVVHTDLKPENILLENRSSSEHSSAFYIADFGSASFYLGKLETDLISTRPYRSPEVVSGYGWSYPADIWSLGCILFEVFTGQALVPHAIHNDHEQLTALNQRLDSELPSYIVAKCKQRRLFDVKHKLLPCQARSDKLRSLREALRNEDVLYDLINSMLHQDPGQRISADKLIDHPFMRASGKVATQIASTRMASGSPMDHVHSKEESRVLAPVPRKEAVKIAGELVQPPQPAATPASQKARCGPPAHQPVSRHEYGLYGFSR